MATLSNEIRLCSVNPKAFLGLSQGRTDNELVVSETRTTVTVYEVKERKAVRSFNTLQSDSLISSVVFNRKQSRYVAALKKNQLRVWSSDDPESVKQQRDGDNISKGKKIKVDHEVDSLWSPCFDSDPLIVYKNGAIEQLTSSSETKVVVEATDDEEARVSFVDVFPCGDRIHVSYIVAKEKNDVKCHHFVIAKSETYELEHRYVSSLSTSNESTIVAFCLVCSTDDGEVELLRFETDGNVHTGVVDTTNNGINWSCQKLKNNFDRSKLTAMISLKSHAVIAQETDDGNIDCTVYNLQYGAPTHKEVIKGSKNLTALKFYKVHDNLLLLSGEDLYLIPYSCEYVELSRVLGTRQSIKDNDVKVNRRAQNLKWTSRGLKVENENNTAADNEGRTKDGQFSQQFLKLLTDIESSCGGGDNEVSSRLFNKLAEAQKFELLGEALTYYKNVPETTLVNALASYLSYEDQRNHFLQNNDLVNGGSCEAQLLPIVDQILTVPINDLFLQEHVRRLPFDQVIFLLQYLHSFLKCFCHMSESDWTKVTKFVDWISVLIDAHFHYLTVMKNDQVHDFLRDLQSTVVNQCEILECLAKIQELILIAKSSGKLNHMNANNGYGIETLHFA